MTVMHILSAEMPSPDMLAPTSSQMSASQWGQSCIHYIMRRTLALPIPSGTSWSTAKVACSICRTTLPLAPCGALWLDSPPLACRC